MQYVNNLFFLTKLLFYIKSFTIFYDTKLKSNVKYING